MGLLDAFQGLQRFKLGQVEAAVTETTAARAIHTDLYLCHRFSERCANRATEMDFDSLGGMVCGQPWGGRSWTSSATCWP